MTSPYINTKLSTMVILHPHQMDNNIYNNLKRNLEKQIVGKCFSNYGYIVKLIEILKYKDGIIEPENTEASASFVLDFSCRICLPLKNTQIICEIERVNKLLITAINGPVFIIIPNDRFNNNVFYKDINNNIRYKKDNNSDIIQPHDFIKVTLSNIQFYDGDEKIKAIGFMDDIASEDDKKNYYNDTYKDSDKLIKYEEYISSAPTSTDNETTPVD
ncbi:DNA-directed RNA polymerase, subunit E'/Rpb7 [Klosneuvirus KNV1]|uniref:DNA-directed RNA polymerase, subunit E'/Rpb7 n=1 Tax=Klosneuvirus KNV1 TaxID=1977640 RepID=A0A1V0SJ46_9VIRU|nr:DNA-directed RNA polymerase, subunit E'/Rpb7 [Klosneuvirus KNV1]